MPELDDAATLSHDMGRSASLLEYDVARFVADSEAISSYEGTREINSLIVGLAITGESAFVSK